MLGSRLSRAILCLALAALPAGCTSRAKAGRPPARPAPSGVPAASVQPPQPLPPPTQDALADELAGASVKSLPAPPKLVKGPWHDAQAGEYVCYRAEGQARTAYRVVSADVNSVVLEVKISLNGQDIAQQMTCPRMAPGESDANGVPPSAAWTDQTLHLAGRDISCRVATWHKNAARDGRTLKLWLSDAVPGRVVRSAFIDPAGRQTVTMELEDFGRN